MKDTVYKVYWSDVKGQVMTPQSSNFDKNQMGMALKFCESLREIQRLTGTIRFITMVSEHPDCTSLSGVAEVDPETYDWKKRRK